MNPEDEAAELRLQADHCQWMAETTRNEDDRHRWQALADRCRAMLANMAGTLIRQRPSDS